jgi:phosphoglycerate dehydrogenase-like enzyme
VVRTVRIALAHATAAEYGDRIRAVRADRVELVPIHGGDPTDPPLDDVEVLLHSSWVGLTPVREVLPRLPALRWVHSTGAGIDDLVSPALRDRGVVVTNASGAYSPAMAEYVVAAMVLLAREWSRFVDAQHERRWVDRLESTGGTLRGKRAGIVGYGSVGRHVAAACKALGMEVWATRRTPTLDAIEPVDRMVPASELETLLAASDFVVVAASLNSTTRRLIDGTTLAAMRPGAFLVNVSRGGLVDQAALAESLAAGRLAGAVLDVTEPEPLPPGDPLWNAPNLWITPHVSGDTPEGWRRCIDLFCANLDLFLDGEEARMGNVVDLDAHL